MLVASGQHARAAATAQLSLAAAWPAAGPRRIVGRNPVGCSRSTCEKRRRSCVAAAQEEQPSAQPAAASPSQMQLSKEQLAEMAALGLSMEDFAGLLEEEDVTVPGSYADALNGNTKLGKAVRAACEELNHLNGMELEMLQQADGMLKKLGVKKTIMEEEPKEEDAAEDA